MMRTLQFGDDDANVSLSPLFAPTPARAAAAKPRQGLQVAVRVKPPPAGVAHLQGPGDGCLSWEDTSVTIRQMEEETTASETPRRPAHGATPGRAPKAQTPGGVRTPGSRMPMSRTPAARTPAGRTPVGRTPGGRTPGGRTPGPPDAPKCFDYDFVCGPECRQEDIFEQTQPLVDAALNGSNACVFAYGQTGAWPPTPPARRPPTHHHWQAWPRSLHLPSPPPWQALARPSQ